MLKSLNVAIGANGANMSNSEILKGAVDLLTAELNRVNAIKNSSMEISGSVELRVSQAEVLDESR